MAGSFTGYNTHNNKPILPSCDDNAVCCKQCILFPWSALNQFLAKIHLLLHSWTIDTGRWMLSLNVVKTALLSSRRGQLYSFSKGWPPDKSTSESNPYNVACTRCSEHPK